MSNLQPLQFTGSTSLAEGHEPEGATVPLYHRTRTPEAAEGIRKWGFRGHDGPIDRGDVWFSSRSEGQGSSYGDHLITVDVPHNHPHLAHTDTWEREDGEEHWYALPADRIDHSWIRQ